MLRRKLPNILATVRNVMCLCFLILVLCVYQLKRAQKNEVITKIPKRAIKYVEFNAQALSPLPIYTIKHFVSKYNSEQRVLNIDIFGPLKSDSPVFVIFVDKFRINLKYLLVSLSNVKGIEDSLLIFSHSTFDENVNNLIQTIDFTSVLQIFYPYSMQIYPNEFPGYQQDDCPCNIDMDTAKSMNCTGADTPDIHGHFRDPIHAQSKHYWWWTMNQVFENIPFLQGHEGFFTLLEDDIFLMEDFIFMTMQMRKICNSISVCEFISLQTPLFDLSYNFDNVCTFSVELTTWDPRDFSAVLSLDSSVWSTIEAHYHLFCYIDDYSWAMSLYYLSLNRKNGARFKVMSSTMPRAYKTSSPRLYDQYLELTMIHILYRILDLQDKTKPELYPSHLEIYFNIELEEDDFMIFDYVDYKGGWNDPRDKNMCNNITTNKIKKVMIEMAHEFHQYV